ncbi:PilN domain-containing protein [Psychrobacillus sp. PGGUH221]|uniref:PilN domain-containing protein n=1 Tax=Psychrobacillus sp. PGGUH221 TaxID=3020058 RepID=UPI0035C6C890
MLLLLNTYLQNYKFEESKIILVADFETMNDITIYVEKLLNSEYFTDVQVQEITNFDTPCCTEESSTTDFDIQSRYSATISLNYLVIRSRVSSL